MGVVGSGKEAQREGVHAYLRVVLVVVQQKPTQQCKAITLQLKVN